MNMNINTTRHNKCAFNINYFIIHHVVPGTVIKMGVESHKLTAARGVALFVGQNETGTKLLDAEGNDVAYPTTYTEQEWLLPPKQRRALFYRI